MLDLAATHGDVAAFTGATLVPGSTTGTLHLVSATELDERVAHLASRAGPRARDIEPNVLVQMVIITDDRRGTVDALRAEHGLDYLSTDELLDLPTLLVGTVGQIADQLRGHRERFGFSYVTILEPFMEAFAPVIDELAGT